MKQTPLRALHEARGAQWMEQYGWEIPAQYSQLADEYLAIQEGCGLVDLSFRGKLRITGRDRRTWLHGQVTQDINGLEDGRVAYAAVLTPQGKMVCDMRVAALPDELILDVPAGTATPIPEYLNHYLIMERAEIEDLTDTWALLSLQGPQSPCAIAAVLGDEATRLSLWSAMRLEFNDEPLYLARLPECGEDGFNLMVPAHCAAALWGALCQHRGALAVHSVGWNALNIRRIEAGIPWWGEELGPQIVPLEARLDHAISFTKGCYVGQEIIARIEARGHVNNLLAGFFVHGENLPERGAEITHEGKKVGTVSSVVHSLRLDRPIALGYLRRELQDPGTRVQAVTPAGPTELEVTSLPFVPNDYPTV
jgi:folate-binding protein YgfZ